MPKEIPTNHTPTYRHLSPLQPIGVFDSGIGGLTVTKAVVELLPQESIIYFGDTARLPYGDKSAVTIQNYSLQITEMLLRRGCKMVIIACNTASAAAYEQIKKHIAGRVLLINVIDPLVDYLVQSYTHKKIGLIGTRQTVKSDIYRRKLEAHAANVALCSLATPLLVPLIEEGFFEHKLTEYALAEYLSRESLAEIDALILGCTHYPVIKNSIRNYYNSAQPQKAVDIVDASRIVARVVKEQLEECGLLNNSDASGAENKCFYVSDYTEVFAASAKLFFGKEVKLQQLDLEG